MNPVYSTFEGVQVVYDEHCTLPARAAGFVRKRIVVGPSFALLPTGEQYALLYHELGHCRSMHMEKRAAMLAIALVPLLWIPFAVTVPIIAALLVWELASWLARRQEHSADAEAVRAGYGSDMVAYLNRVSTPEHDGSSDFYPSHAERIAYIASIERAQP